jgi:NAD(P)-dependent dehydrogenase (short-subunit alcohol dehydrogenase family)
MEWYYYLTLIPILYYLLRYYFNGPKTKLTKDMTGKIIVITGSSAGVGMETARDLLKTGARVIFACRNEEKTIGVISQMENKERAIFIHLNLASFKSVFSFVEQFKQQFNRLDILINNAGIVNLTYKVTEDGIEETFQTNHLSPTLLTGLLMDRLLESDEPRIINVGSTIHTIAKMDEKILEASGFSTFGNYALSKIGNFFLTRAIHSYNDRIKTVTVHPGAVLSDMSKLENKPIWVRMLYYLFIHPISVLTFKDNYMGAQTTLHCCYMDRESLVSQGYYKDCKIAKEGDTINNDFGMYIGRLTKKYIENLGSYSGDLKDEWQSTKSFIEHF